MTLLHEQNFPGNFWIPGRVTTVQHTAGQDISGSQGQPTLTELTVPSGMGEGALNPLPVTSIAPGLPALPSPELSQLL